MADNGYKKGRRMKKAIVIALAVTILSGALCACADPKISIDVTDWRLQVAQKVNVKDQEIEVIARGDDWIVEDMTVPVVDVLLIAKEGKITITDNGDSDDTFGTYQSAEAVSRDTVLYEVTVNDLFGSATVSVIKLDNGEDKALILTLFDGDIQYTMNFVSVN